MVDDKKKTTVLGSSVGADAGQPLNLNDTNIAENNDECNEEMISTDEMLKKLRRATAPLLLRSFSYNELLGEVLPYRKSVIDGFLGVGAYILAGAPKIGKSFLVAQIAYHVSIGEPIFNYKVHKGTVLYLALEDDKKRLQERMSRMFGVEGTDNLHFATEASQVGKDLEKQLENFVREHPKTVLIIDTLQKVREVSTDYSYASDYEIMGKLKQFADLNNICLLIVHHTRKQSSGDNFEMISGTTGLLGCADGALLMMKEKRTDSNATLNLVSRDQADQKLYLTKNQNSLIRELDRAETDLWRIPPDPIVEKVVKMLSIDDPYWEGTATNLVKILGVDMTPNHLTRHLNVHSSELMTNHRIYYENKRTHSGRHVAFTLVPEELLKD